MDQALFAGTNFLVGLLLARWLAPAAYGAFSTAYSVFLLIGTLHNALWIDPMAVYGSGRFREKYADYQRVVLRYHWQFGALAVVLFTLTGVGFLLAGQDAFGRSFLGLAIATPLVLYLWLARRAAYVVLEPRLAAIGGALYLVLYAGLVALLVWLGWLNETSALAVMGLSAWLTGQWVVTQARRKSAAGEGEISAGEVRSLHWEYGRWALLSSTLSWAAGNLLFMLLPFYEKLDAIGGLRALLTVFQPPIQVNSALAAFLVTTFASMKSEQSRRTLVIAASVGLMLMTAVYCAIFIMYGEPVVGFLLGTQYQQYVPMFIWPLTMLAMFTAFTGVLSSYFKSKEKPQILARGLFFSAMVSTIVALIILPFSGATGAAWVMAGIYGFMAVYLIWRWLRD